MQSEPQKQIDVVVRCDCGSSHFASVRYWRDDAWKEGYFEVVMGDCCDRGWRRRLGAAWRILRGGCVERNDIVLSEDKAARLIEALTPIAQGS
jgi:hypothetical protein